MLSLISGLMIPLIETFGWTLKHSRHSKLLSIPRKIIIINFNNKNDNSSILQVFTVQSSVSNDPYELRKYVYDALGYNLCLLLSQKQLSLWKGKRTEPFSNLLQKLWGSLWIIEQPYLCDIVSNPTSVEVRKEGIG